MQVFAVSLLVQVHVLACTIIHRCTVPRLVASVEVKNIIEGPNLNISKPVFCISSQCLSLSLTSQDNVLYFKAI